MNQIKNRSCAHCGKTFNGRADKRFCDDYCRSSFNNQLKSNTQHIVRSINKKLLRNRNILEKILASKASTTRISEKELYRSGFDFEYFTHAETHKNGQTSYYCYEYGYCVHSDHIKVLRKIPD